MQRSRAAARDNALFHGSLGRIQGILNAQLLLFHLDLSGSADFDDGNTAGQLGKTLLQLLLVEVAGRLRHLRTDLRNTVADSFLVAHTVYDGGIFLRYLHLAGTAQHIDGGVFQLITQLFADNRAARQNGDVLQHFLAAVAKAGSFDRDNRESPAQAVHDQRGQSLALHIFGNDDEFLAGLYDLLQQGQNILNHTDLLIRDEQICIIQNSLHALGVCDHIRSDIAAVELHALYDFGIGLSRLALFNGDHAVSAYLFHRLSDQAADDFIARRNRGNTRHVGRALHFLAVRLQSLDRSLHGLLHAALQVHGVCTRGNVLHALGNKRLCQNRCGGGTVAGSIVRFGGNFAYELSAHVLELVFQLDLFGDGNAVIGDDRSAKLFAQNYVASLGAKCDLDRIGKLINAGAEGFARLFAHE